MKYTAADEVKTLANGEVVLIYTNAAATDASFEFQGLAMARILAVGGGGGAGGTYQLATSKGYDGGSGGGGAGAFVEVPETDYAAATYTVTIGAGGAAGGIAGSRSGVKPGEKGGETKVESNVSTVVVSAEGGGGGGGECAGQQGGSGGGGSMHRDTSSNGTPMDGGAPTVLTFGSNGGVGNIGNFGGGGGGAGGDGSPANAADGGVGGVGKPCDIAVDAGTPKEDWPWYAGGGAGGNNDSKTTLTEAIPGGKGGGGAGGVGKGVAAPEDGVDGTGGGGGGSSYNVIGGRGGSGIVIVRISMAVGEKLEKPKDVVYPYDGTVHYAVKPLSIYEISGDNAGTDPGIYYATVKPSGTLTWDDDTTDPVRVRMVITEADAISGEVEVMGAPVSFIGASETNWVTNAEGEREFVLKFTGSGFYTLPGTTIANYLAVGGGGGAGGTYQLATSKGYDGGSGGGGAGAFVEVVSNLYSQAEYEVNVGSGGAAGAIKGSRSSVTAGENGGDTIIKTNGVAMITAIGGGGGGGETVGSDGGSGGGGSMHRDTSSDGTPKDGGKAKDPTQGSNGGVGNIGNFGGGGGGAGGAGLPADAEGGGAGGIGRPSNIEVDYGTPEEDWPWYAGGGAGGNNDSKTTLTEAIPGGKGGGGAGGVGKGVAAPEDGVDGTGGGGGGSSYNVIGGRGGNGVFIIRIVMTMNGNFERPDPVKEVPYNGKGQYSVRNTMFYSVTGQNCGTNVGEYVAYVKLNEGYTWPDGGTDEVEVTLKINPCPTTFSNLHVDDWEFGTAAEDVPQPTCTVDPEWVTPAYEWRARDQGSGIGDQGWKPWSGEKPEKVGEYEIRVGAPDRDNYSFSYAESTFRVTKIHVTFSNLVQRDWMEGTPPEAIPRPTCNVTPAWVTPVYEYEDAEGNWGADRPTTLGEHRVRVRTENDDDYEYNELEPVTFKIVKGLGAQFIDYVEIELGGYHAGGELTNFPYRIALDEPTYDVRGLLESGLPGFLYSRAGERGDELAFTDEDGNVLDYTIAKWDDRGESALVVKVPLITAESQTIRLYWYLRPGATAPDHHPTRVYSDWSAEEAQALYPLLTHEFDLVVKNGFRVNYWTEKPSLSKTVWSDEDGKADPYRGGVLSGNAVVKDGVEVLSTLTDAFTGETFTFDAAKVRGGSYRLACWIDNPEPCFYESDLKFFIDFCVTTRTTFDDLSGGTGSLTLGGRVMLANDDNAPGHEIWGQNYWQTDPASNVWWVHEGSHAALASYLPNVYSHPGTSHRLYAVQNGETNLLWRFESVVIGNNFNGSSLATARNYLPYSTTGVSIKPGSTAMNERDGAGQIILRNSLDAKVFSPCYTNGIGTIYFDAVNAWRNFSGFETSHRIAVEIATETDDGLPPTDKNACNPGSDDLARITGERWKRCKIIALRRDNGETAFTRLEPMREVVELDIAKGGSQNNFFRLCVPVNVSGYVRFRIVRLDPCYDGSADGSGYGYILLDNLIVSPGKMSARMEPLGVYDDTKLGKRAVGWEGGRSVPFPSVTGREPILLGGRPVVDGNGTAGVDPASFLQLTRLWYRDRYLNQRLGEWKPVDLSPGNGFMATTPLDLRRGAEGDVEWWYESFTKIPAYDYYDYSGADAARETKLGGLYREETSFVTNRLKDVKSKYARVTSGGDDWFFRFRAGVDDWSGCQTVFNGEPFEMELIGDHLWRALVKLPKDLSGEVAFHFAATNRWEAWGEAPVEAARRWYPTLAVTKLPFRGEANTHASADKTVAVDGASGYLEFQFNDETGIYSVGHAEYQEFSGWNDAKVEKDGSKEWFKGNYTETSGVNTAEQILTNAHMNTWALWNRSLTEWNETFELGSYIGDVKSGYPKYTADYLSPASMPKSWEGANGIFVDEQMTESNLTTYAANSGIAWQMQGKGKGSVSYTRGDGPSGLDVVTFKARLAQRVTFDDFSVMEGDGSTLQNVTFLFPAVMSTANGADLSPNASMSLVGYYRRGRGCYEFRVTKRFTNGLLLEIYKWLPDDETDEMKATCLGSVWYAGATFQHNGETCRDPDFTFSWPKAFGFFLSIDTTTVKGKATILAGLTQSAYDPSAAAYYGTDANGPVYRALEVVDDTDPLASGAFGALSTNCRGIFLGPTHWDKPVATVNGLENVSAAMKKAWPKLTRITNLSSPATKVSFTQTKTDDGTKIRYDDWNFPIAREEKAEYKVSNTKTLWGLTTPADLMQKVGVYLKPRTGAGAWTLFGKEWDVTSFSFEPHTVQVRTNAELQVMLKTGKKATDVAVHTITQNAWNGEDINNLSGIAEDFVYTQACIEERVTDGVKEGTKVTNRVTRLVPARAMVSRAVAVRSPILKGLGMIGFKYDGVQPGCRILVQMATNDVRRSLAGTGGYNYSTNQVPFGSDQPVGTWVTLRAYDADELGESGEQTYYLGLHDRKGDPIEGVFRVTLDPGTVMEAAKWGPSNPEWGSVTLTDVYVRNEPPIDDRSWLGWNLRVLGDGTDEEKRMYLPDMYGEGGLGNSAALNNSYDNIVGSIDQYDKNNPYIQSPTFGSYVTPSGEVRRATVGQIRFRARLYDNTGSANPKAATVSLYGAKDGTAGAWGDPIETFAVSNRDFRIYEYKAPAGTDYAAMRLVIDGVTAGSRDAVRVLLDEIVVSEKSDSKVGFVYARPFRTGLGDDWVIEDILDKSQQPLSGESWGVQTQLRLDQLANDIDVDRGFRVTLQYHEGIDVWGWQNWAGKPGSSKEVDLVQVGAKTNLIFRSTKSDPSTVVPPTTKANATVQYLVTVYYYQRGSDVLQSQPITASEWTNPEWYEPVDLNADYDDGSGTRWSPYTILESVAPGRVWINEVNFNDGDRTLNRGYDCLTNQFVEIAVPWGVDLTGWELWLYDVNKNSTMLARFGEGGVPAVKQPTAYKSDRYEFMVLVSPKTAAEGGVADPGVAGRRVMDAVWTGYLQNGTFPGQSMMYEEPYQFELVRPSGIVEHQFVVGGTNELRGTDWESLAYLYDGTNLVNELNEIAYSPKRFFAGDDQARKPDGRTFSSFGVLGAGHGEEGLWSAEKGLTPGRLNEDQEELKNWWIDPLGGAIWVYAQVLGSHLVQKIGDDTKADTFFVINSGSSTSIQYRASAWYGIGALTVNGVTNAEAIGKSDYTLNLNNVTETTYVVAQEGLSQTLLDAGLDPSDRYAPAVQKWLADRTAAGTLYNPEGPIVLGKYKGLQETDTPTNLTLTAMYWLDMDPTRPGWWLRGNIVDILGEEIHRKRKWNEEWTEHYTNRQVTVKLYMTNETYWADEPESSYHAPYRLQGLGNEQSDTFTGTWTSETFQVTAYLNNGLKENAGFLPFRCFIFDRGSFDENFESVIEILDPFSQSSPGQAYGWSSWRGTSLWFRWNLGDVRPPAGVDKLKAVDTYDYWPYEDD